MAPGFPPPRYVGCYFGKCDFCEQENQLPLNLMVSIKDNYGWISCETCLPEAEQARLFHIYNKNDLEKEFGENFKVRRSSGDYETDWKIQSYGYRVNGDIIVPLEKKDGTVLKKVPLESLREWN